MPVAHACGHDLHMACLLAAVRLMAEHRDRWNGTLLALFQPAEETGDGAQGMVADGLFKRIPVPDVALSQHLLPGIAGTVGTCPGPFMSAEDGIAITVYGRGGHGALPQNTIDPVVLAAMIIVRLQTVVSRVVTPGDTAIVTVGAVQAGAAGTSSPITPSCSSTCAATRSRPGSGCRTRSSGSCAASARPPDRPGSPRWRRPWPGSGRSKEPAWAPESIR